ncbi:hypothetical protein RDWZM_010243 [Blomia tropicalis]|uniref:Uncharacterized protein n=1 Tax=Blomia tropicalis TaxID=40697 RepID=A0A9Q0LZ19_BLOTA|nr:hypothetical protein RDWZM_010243 [Blomia tropicalis]
MESYYDRNRITTIPNPSNRYYHEDGEWQYNSRQYEHNQWMPSMSGTNQWYQSSHPPHPHPYSYYHHHHPQQQQQQHNPQQQYHRNTFGDYPLSHHQQSLNRRYNRPIVDDYYYPRSSSAAADYYGGGGGAATAGGSNDLGSYYHQTYQPSYFRPSSSNDYYYYQSDSALHLNRWNNYHPYNQHQHRRQLSAPPYYNTNMMQSSNNPRQYALNSTTKSKNPFGPAGPYGSDSSNPLLDYYRKLYYPYDPITGEYMKDATPPGQESTRGGGGLGGGSGGIGGSGGPPLTGVAAMTNAQQLAYLRTGALPPGMGGSTTAHSHISSAAAARSGPYGGGGPMMDSYGGGGPSQMMTNYYGPYMDQDQDSLLLCCDFLIPRPSITCLIISLFVILVMIIIFTVIKFTIIYPMDASNAETVMLLDQIVYILLFAAIVSLLWIFGIYFTSRRTRRQITSLLSCTNGGIGLQGVGRNSRTGLGRGGIMSSIDHTIMPIDNTYEGYVYANSGTNAATNVTHQHQHNHHSHRTTTGNGSINTTRSAAGNVSNYRYANNFV